MATKKIFLKLQSVSILLFLGLSWGAGYSIARYVTLHGLSAITFSFYLAIGPAILLCLIVWLRGLSLNLSWEYWRYYILAGLMGVVIPNTNMYLAAAHLPAGMLSIIVNVSPIIIYPLALLASQERFKWLRFIGVLLGFLGVLLITIPAAKLNGIDSLRWVLLALISPLSFAASTVYIAKYRPVNSDSVALSAGMLLISAIILVPIMLLFAQDQLSLSVWHLVNGLVLLQILLSTVGTVLLFYLIKIAGPVYFSLVSCLVVLAGVFWGWLFFSEELTLLVFFSLLLIVIAIILVTMVRRNK